MALTNGRHEDDDEVVLTYSAFSNISFHGVLATGVTWKEWRELSGDEQDEVIRETTADLLDIGIQDDEA
ncbi:MAG TPA: hypothetical protein VGJ95_13665 [Pseudonocardiaceae bacterium]|jgi:hypothetical protein